MASFDNLTFIFTQLGQQVIEFAFEYLFEFNDFEVVPWFKNILWNPLQVILFEIDCAIFYTGENISLFAP